MRLKIFATKLTFFNVNTKPEKSTPADISSTLTLISCSAAIHSINLTLYVLTSVLATRAIVNNKAIRIKLAAIQAHNHLNHLKINFFKGVHPSNLTSFTSLLHQIVQGHIRVLHEFLQVFA